MKINEINKRIKQIVFNNPFVVFFCNNNAPFLQFNRILTEQQVPTATTIPTIPTIPTATNILFVLGIKDGLRYHLNVIIYNIVSNTIERFEPYGVEKTHNETKINKFILDSVSLLFKVKKTPLLIYNKTKVQKEDNKCAICCLKYIKMKFNN